MPITGLSAATQNIILLRHIEHRATMLRVMGILKVRDDDYDGRMRELQITDNGIQLLDTFAAESRVASGGGVVERRAQPEGARSNVAVATQRSILIVDDEFGLAEMLREMLRELRLRRDLGDQRPPGARHPGRTQDRPRHHGHDDAGDGRHRARHGDAEQRGASRHPDRDDDLSADGGRNRATCSTPSSESRSRRICC